MNKTKPKVTVLEPKAPTDLRKILSTPKVMALWKDLTPIARRDFIGWIESAKQAETRARRIKRVPDMLASGKRRPCCYAVVPMNFYKALGGTPNAKIQWSKLTPTERRDFVSWVNMAKDPEAHKQRVEKACLALAAGKRRP